MSGLIAIVGRPNVGKSALFNRIAGKRIAIVHDLPGVTRDRVSAEVEWQGRPFTLVDTGGIGLRPGEKAADAIMKAALEQVDVAIESASVILLVVNVREGVVPMDQEVASRLRQCDKPVILAINKADHQKSEEECDEFAALGFESQFPISAAHNRGIDALMQEAIKRLDAGKPAASTDEPHSADPDDSVFKLAIVGRPNVGKSSIINALTQSDRVIVSPVSGTTRDAVDVPFQVETEGIVQHYVLIDTAGIRKRTRVGDSIEFFSVKRAEESIARCDLAVLIVDAEEGVTEQDKKIAGKILEERRACIVVVNKWDLVEEEVKQAQKSERKKPRERRHNSSGLELITLSDFGSWVQEQLFFIGFAPVIFTSAKTGFHLPRLLEAVRFVFDQWRQQIPTALLNKTLQQAIDKHSAPARLGKRLKFYYATQTSQSPPTFLLFVNQRELFEENYGKFLTSELRKAFGFEGCPIHLVPKSRPKTIPPMRKRKSIPKRPKAKTKGNFRHKKN